MANEDQETPLTGADRASALEDYFGHSPDAVLLVDDSGRIVIANAATEGVLGYRPESLCGQSIGLLVPERFTQHEQLLRSYFADPTPRPMGSGLDLVATTADGREIPVDIALTPLTVAGHRLAACSIRPTHGAVFAGETLRVLATALRAAASGIVITDREGTITWVNPAACAITGFDSDELIGHHTRLLKSGEHEPAFYEDLWKTVLQGEAWSGTIVNRRKDGSLYHEEQTIAPVLDVSGRVARFIAIKQDVSEQRRLQRDLQRANEELAGRMAEIEALNGLLRDQAIRDPLTHLYNRRYLDEALPREVARLTDPSRSLAVAAIDIDHFKRVNDALGHAVGDRVLQQLAEVLRAHVRKSDLICRLGGDEFVVVMPGAEIEVAMERTERWREAFAAASSETLGPLLSCTVSIGVADHRDTAQATLRRADAALYAAKRAGRNRVHCAGENDPSAAT